MASNKFRIVEDDRESDEDETIVDVKKETPNMSVVDINDSDEDEEHEGENEPLLNVKVERNEDKEEAHDVFKIEKMRRVYKTSKKWFIALMLLTVFWFCNLIGLSVLQHRNKETCSASATFNEFALCIICYLIVLYLIDCFLLGATMHISKKFLKHHTLQEIKQLMSDIKKLPRDLLPEKRNFGKEADLEAISDTIEMGREIMTKTAANKKIREVSQTPPDKPSENAAEAVFKLRDIFQDSNLTATEIKEKIKDKSLPVSSILLTANAIPLLSIIFFIVMGIGTMEKMRNNSGKETWPKTCLYIYVYDWLILFFTLMHSLFKLIPVVKVITTWRRRRTHVSELS